MSDTENVLVIILASALAIFLVLAIIATVKLIQILGNIKRISEKAEHIADTAESAAHLMKNMAGPMALGRMVASMAEMVINRSKPRKGRREK